MAIIVEHEKRRKEILEKALTVFVDDGFENATFQKIADRCGITRTILYLYFKNKKEIFRYSIKQFLLNAEDNMNAISTDKTLNSTGKIKKMFFEIFKELEENRQFLFVIMNYLLYLARREVEPEKRVRRRTIKFRFFLTSLMIEGIKAGEIKKVNVKIAGNYLYYFLEDAIFQLVVLKRKNLNELREAVVFAIDQLTAKASS